MDPSGVASRCGHEGVAFDKGDRAAAQLDAEARVAGISLGQWPRSSPIWFGLRTVDARRGRRTDSKEIQRDAWCDSCWRTAGETRTDAAKAVAARLPARSAGDRKMAARDLSGNCQAGPGAECRDLLLG